MKIKLKNYIHMACNCGKKQNVGSQPIVKKPSMQKIVGSGASVTTRRIIRRAKWKKKVGVYESVYIPTFYCIICYELRYRFSL